MNVYRLFILLGSNLKRGTLIWVLPSENGCKTYPVGQKLKAFRDKLSRLKLIPVISKLRSSDCFGQDFYIV